MSAEALLKRTGLHEPSLALWSGALLFVSLSIQFGLLWFREFDPDEFQHLHAAWCVSKGMIPYVDFFGHHTPGLWFLLAPLLRLFRPEADFGNAFYLLFFCRTLMTGLSLMILALTWKLGRLWRGEAVGAGAAVLLAGTLMFLEKCIETRVDVPAPLLLMAGLCLLFQAIRDGSGRTSGFAWAGFLYGCALMTTQKMLMVLPGLATVLAWYILDGRIQGNWKGKIGRAVLFGGCALVPAGLVLLYFHSQQAADSFLHNNFTLNFNWRMRFSPALTFDKLLRQNSITAILAAAGFLTSLLRLTRRESVRRGDFVLALPLASFLAGAYAMPVPQREYFMEFLPLGAIFASWALNDSLEFFAGFGRSDAPGEEGGAFRFKVLALAGIVSALYMGTKGLRVVDKNALRLSFALLAGAAALAALNRFSRWPKIIAFASLSLYGGGQAVQYFGWTNFETLNNLRFVDQRVGPEETVMDGWSGAGVFRPHAWHYYFIHTEIRYLLDPPQIRRIVEGFESGTAAPKVVFLDEFVKSVSPRLTDHLRKNYQATLVSERGTFLVRRTAGLLAKKSPYAPPGRSMLPRPGEFELVVR